MNDQSKKPRPSILDYAPRMLASIIGGRDLWGLADQLLISFTNFATMILVAHGLHDKAAFGTFTLIYSALLFANMLQFALITQPHNVIGATRSGEDYALYTSATGFVQVTLALTLGAVAAVVALWGQLAHASFAPQLIALVPAIVAWQLQEFIRRVLYTEGRLRDAFINDIVSYGGQTLIMAVLWWQMRLTGAEAIWALAVTSGIASVFGAVQIRASLRARLEFSAIRENWHFGKWLLGSELLNWASSLQMYLYVAAILLGTAASGTLRAAQILFGPARVFSFLLQSLLPIRFSKALANEGPAAMGSQMRRACIMVLLLLGPYCLVLALFPRLVLTVVFGPSYAEQPYVLSLFSLQSMLTYFVMVVAAALSALRMTWDIFIGSVYSCVAAALLSLPFIRLMGMGGVIACMMVSSTVMTIYLVSRYRASIRPIPEIVPAVALSVKEQACTM